MFFAFATVGAFGQQGNINLGLGASYGGDLEEFGIFARGEYGVTDNIRAAATFNYFLIEDTPSIQRDFNTLNFDVHYLLANSDGFQLYALGGVNIAFSKVTIDLGSFGSTSGSNSEIGINAGGGLRFHVTEQLAPLVEVKYVIGDASQIVIMAGAAYTINN